MGLLDGQTQSAYYAGSDLGNYQFITLDNIITNFMYIYVGENKIISKVNRTDVQFHAMRALQELSYDVLRSFKSQEIEVPNTLKMALPHDYVNYIKLTRSGNDGIERVLYPTSGTSNPFAITQATDGTYTTQNIKRQYTMRVPDDVTSPATAAGARIADGDYLSLYYEKADGTTELMYFIFNSDDDIDDGTNPQTNRPGPYFEVDFNVNMTRSELLTALKTAIDLSNRFTTEISGDNLVITQLTDFTASLVTYAQDTINVQEGFFAASQVTGGGSHISSPSLQAATAADNGGWAFSVTQDNASTSTDLTEQSPSNTLSNFQDTTESDTNTTDVTDVKLDYKGRRYGLDPQHAQNNGTFYIDNLRGYIHFGANLIGDTIILKYVSDSLGTDSEMVVHKFCEEACYKHIMYGVLSGRSNMPEYIVQRFKKERFAETRKAKIRLSNIKIEEFTQVLKGMGKQIK
tara:strand:+ start:758 stop:2140 length:1383 start_codon:yes stop_codon:yes gene_type:complete